MVKVPPEVTQACEIQVVLTELQHALDAEYNALNPVDAAALITATNTKIVLLRQLASMGIGRYTRDSLGEGRGDWWQVRHQLDTCRRINTINGGIVSRRLRQVQRALGILLGTESNESRLYGPAGLAGPHRAPRDLAEI